MFDIGKEKVTIDCPTCKKKHQVTLQQIANGSTIRCFCNTNIKLQDKNGSARRGINDLNKSMKKLDDMIKRFGK